MKQGPKRVENMQNLEENGLPGLLLPLPLGPLLPLGPSRALPLRMHAIACEGAIPGLVTEASARVLYASKSV